MSMSSGNGTGAMDQMDDGDTTLWVGLGLAEAAAGAKVGPVPVADILAGGRRLRRRRHALVGMVALGSAMVLAGGAMAALHGAAADGGSVAAIAPANAGPGGGTGGGPSFEPPAGAVAAVRNPLVPVRTVLAQGTVDGKEWKVWAALWPLAPQERAYEQALAVWNERRTVDPELSRPTEDFVRQYWQPDSDVVNVYFTVDGVRLGHDSEGTALAPGHLPPQAAQATTFGGGLLGHRGKDDTVAPLDVATVALGPNVGRVVVTWTDGTTTEPQAVTVGDSPIRRIALAAPDGKKAKSWQFYDRNGAKLPNDGIELLS
ncbi:hypothetical protein [Kitasatospora sp. NPDC097643]|uniref:hypothetical protein n=1 Tax=Kitasatospora sp. NPDC097643 TaxID=3157230 RepID=UPI003319EE32